MTALNYEIAMAAAKDEANRNARRNGRTVWSVDDFNLCVKVFSQLLPEEDFPLDTLTIG